MIGLEINIFESQLRSNNSLTKKIFQKTKNILLFLLPIKRDECFIESHMIGFERLLAFFSGSLFNVK